MNLSLLSNYCLLLHMGKLLKQPPGHKYTYGALQRHITIGTDRNECTMLGRTMFNRDKILFSPVSLVKGLDPTWKWS